ncbi:related to Aquaporin 3 [Melanopsichium pennsylvanicum]|uniref:Related to Aquaporin 3 n=2 Tax=Melanopsichium pennsylvanicum TaxID=63383 RepID=A0AAJ4XLQ7_9BASI|nr:related to Aquaporin 3 [Melanopsichium pennsylvanicum 4]SNX83393.1 related to Aquaporin 3 [Melanopsichium pennsylvanicum]
MSRLKTRSTLSAHDVHPEDPSHTAPLLPASAPLAHQQTRLHKAPRWWPSPSSPNLSSTAPYSHAPHVVPNSWARIRHLYREELAEFFGTFLILIFGAGTECQVNLHYESSSTRPVAAYGSYFQSRLSWAAGVAMAVWVSGGISGGHCNPSVTIALSLFRGFPKRKILPFIFAQTLGATAASLLVYLNNYTHITLFEGGENIRTLKGPTSTAGFFFTVPNPDLSYPQAFFSEFFATSILILVVFALADPLNLKPPKGTMPFAMFLVLLGIGSSMGFNTGYAINGARDTGPRIALWLVGYGGEVWSHDGGYWLWAPWIGSILGGIVGAGAYDTFLYTGLDSPMNKPKMIAQDRNRGYGALAQEDDIEEEVA